MAEHPSTYSTRKAAKTRLGGSIAQDSILRERLRDGQHPRRLNRLDELGVCGHWHCALGSDQADKLQLVRRGLLDLNEREIKIAAGHFSQPANPVLHFDAFNFFMRLSVNATDGGIVSSSTTIKIRCFTTTFPHPLRQKTTVATSTARSVNRSWSSGVKSASCFNRL
jgi:hypothetical protein